MSDLYLKYNRGKVYSSAPKWSSEQLALIDDSKKTQGQARKVFDVLEKTREAMA